MAETPADAPPPGASPPAQTTILRDEKDAATAFLQLWSQCARDPAATISQLEEELKILAAVGNVALEMWDNQYDLDAGKPPSSAVQATRRQAFFRGPRLDRAAQDGGRRLDVYVSLVTGEDSAVNLILDRSTRVEQSVAGLARRGLEETRRLREAIESQRDALDGALPGSKVEHIAADLGKLSETLTKIQSRVAPDHSAEPLDIIKRFLKWLGIETVKATSGLVGAILLVTIIGLIAGLFGRGITIGLQHEAQMPGVVFQTAKERAIPGAKPAICPEGYAFYPPAGVCAPAKR